MIPLLPVLLILFYFTGSESLLSQPGEAVYFGSGFQIGEVSDQSAVVRVRLSANPEPLPVRHARKAPPFRSPLDFDDGMPVEQMDGYLGGAFGEVNIRLVSAMDTFSSGWQYVSPLHDFSYKHPFTRLSPSTSYAVVILGRVKEGLPESQVMGSFTTAPNPNESVPVTFVATTCQYFWDFDDPDRGFRSYDAMSRLEPSFICQTGDYVYYDKAGPIAHDVATARHKWNAINAWPSLIDLYRKVPAYLQKDDHDLLRDDATPFSPPYGTITYADGLEIWREQVPILGRPYRTFRWGKDLQIWLLEVREYRSDNRSPDNEEKTILGNNQLSWLRSTLDTSKATFKIILTPTPIVGPDRAKGKRDNHSNAAFATAGNRLREMLSAHPNLVVINGDRHWQYVSRDPQTQLLEVSVGPISDAHAQGWPPDDRRPEHRFLRVKGGFLSVSVDRNQNVPFLTFFHHNVDGEVVHKETFNSAED